MLAVWRKQRTGTFLASEGELRISGNASCKFYQALDVIPGKVHTDGAGKGPRCSTYSKAAEFPMAEKKTVGVPGISFLLGVTSQLHFM